MSAVKDELVQLQKQQPDGLLTVEMVVGWSKAHPESALYRELEWDDARAGHDWRCYQVRKLIALHVVSLGGVRQMVSLSLDRVNPGGGYRELETVLGKPDLRAILLRDALADLERVRRKYEALAELAHIWDALDRAQAKQDKAKGGKPKPSRPETPAPGV